MNSRRLHAWRPLRHVWNQHAARVPAGILSAICGMLLSHGSVHAQQEWPMWGRTPGRNMVAAGVHGLPLTWDADAGTAVKWRAQLGDTSYGNPVLAGGKLFVGTNNGSPRDANAQGDRGVLMCFNAADGAFLWQDTYEKLAAGDAQDWRMQGICSSPAVDGQRVFYVNNRGQVVAADTEGFYDNENDGPFTSELLTEKTHADIVWRFDMIQELGVNPHFMTSTNPLVVGDLVFVVTSNGVGEDGRTLPNPKAPSVIALDKSTGKLVWQEASPAGSAHSVRMADVLEGQWSSVSHGVVMQADGTEQPQLYFAGGDGWLYALEPTTGKLIWKLDCNPKEAKWVPGGRGDRNYLVSTPVFVDNRVYVAVGQDPEHGGGPGHLYAIDCRGTGDVTSSHVVWHVRGEDFGRSISTVAIHDGVVYAAELDGFLRAIDAETGRELWQYDSFATVWGSPLVAEGRVYLCDEDGDVAVFEAGRSLKILAENRLPDAIYSTPISVGTVLYIATKSELIALESSTAKSP